jgi:predicted Fe-S protein YdhL (DUF1289 family)
VQCGFEYFGQSVFMRKFDISLESPCTKICKLDESGQYCIGCFRTRTDIGVWSRATDDEKVDMIEAAKKRAHKLGQ